MKKKTFPSPSQEKKSLLKNEMFAHFWARFHVDCSQIALALSTSDSDLFTPSPRPSLTTALINPENCPMDAFSYRINTRQLDKETRQRHLAQVCTRVTRARRIYAPSQTPSTCFFFSFFFLGLFKRRNVRESFCTSSSSRIFAFTPRGCLFASFFSWTFVRVVKESCVFWR